jgi:hypothetical protein
VHPNLMSNSPPDRLWTGTFILVCTAQFFGSAQHALLQPTFPLSIAPLFFKRTMGSVRKTHYGVRLAYCIIGMNRIMIRDGA